MRVLNSLWVGDQLGILEQLCIRSALAAGHPFHLYSYEPSKLRGVPDGVEVRDAAEVMPRERMIAYAECNSYALGANFWRYELLGLGLGYWVDLDVLIIKPFDFEQDYVFGAEQEGTINTAVLLAPKDSPLVKDLKDLPERVRCPPWYGPRRSVQYYLRRIRQGPLRLEDYPWGTFGPGMMGYLVGRHDLAKFVQPHPVLYPVSWRNAKALYGPRQQVEAMLSEETRAIHLYNSQLRELAKAPPPAGSFMAEQFAKHGF
jgi:hypothetical protein